MNVFEDLEQRRIEDDSAILTHDRERVTGRQPGSVTSAGGERVEYVGKAEDPRRKRNIVPGQAIRVPTAVPMLMVVAHHRSDVPRELDLTEQVNARLGMLLHCGPLLGGKGAGFVQD